MGQREKLEGKAEETPWSGDGGSIQVSEIQDVEDESGMGGVTEAEQTPHVRKKEDRDAADRSHPFFFLLRSH